MQSQRNSASKPRTKTCGRRIPVYGIYSDAITAREHCRAFMKASSGRPFAISNGSIMDDGSTDGTRELIAQWQAESNFPIRYFFQENQGKPAAFNHGVQEARGELFLTLDSDDGCIPEALERFKYHWESIPASGKR